MCNFYKRDENSEWEISINDDDDDSSTTSVVTVFYSPVQRYVAEDEGDAKYVHLGQVCLGLTGAKTIISFGGGSCVKSEYEELVKLNGETVRWHIFPPFSRPG
jgi:hypothetical protein